MIPSFPTVRATQEAARSVMAGNAEFPFPWSAPGVDAVWISARGSIALDVPGSGFQTVCTLTIPDGFEACIRGILNVFTGSGFIEGSGDLLWKVDVNSEPGAPSISGRPVPGYDAINTTLGSFGSGPWPVDAAIGWRFKPGDVIRYKVASVNAGPSIGDPVVCILQGWRWPVQRGGF